MKAANRIYVNEHFVLKEEFQSTLQKYFGAKAEALDFKKDAARIYINHTVDELTCGKIRDLLPKGTL